MSVSLPVWCTKPGPGSCLGCHERRLLEHHTAYICTLQRMCMHISTSRSCSLGGKLHMYTLHQSPCLIPHTHCTFSLLDSCRPGANQADVLASTRRLVEVLSKDPDPKMKVGGVVGGAVTLWC
jgi:hypothetical protein